MHKGTCTNAGLLVERQRRLQVVVSANPPVRTLPSMLQQQPMHLQECSWNASAVPRSSASGATATVAVLYSGQLRSVLKYPGLAANHARFFNGLLGRRDAWDSFLFADVGDYEGKPDPDQCGEAGWQVVRNLAPVVARAWAPAVDGEVPWWRVSGHCSHHSEGSQTGCVPKNVSHNFAVAVRPGSGRFTHDQLVALAMRNKHHLYRAFRLMESYVASHRAGRRSASARASHPLLRCLLADAAHTPPPPA